MASDLSSGQSSTGQEFTLNPALIVSSKPVADILKCSTTSNRSTRATLKATLEYKTSPQRCQTYGAKHIDIKKRPRKKKNYAVQQKQQAAEQNISLKAREMCVSHAQKAHIPRNQTVTTGKEQEGINV